MTPFLGDAAILEKVFRGDAGIWRDMHGSIKSVRLFDRIAAEPKSQKTTFSIEIITDEPGFQSTGKEQKTCTGVFRIEANWDFMDLKAVSVRKIKIECI